MANMSLGDFANNETLIVTVTVIDADTETGFDMSDATITFAIHEHNGHSNIISVTNADGIDDTNAATGVLVIRVESSSMDQLDAKSYDWELHVAFNNGDDVTPAQGTMNVLEGFV